MIDWGEDDSPPKLERWLLRMVLGYSRPNWRRGALGLYGTLYERQFCATSDPDDLTAIGVEPIW